MSGAAVVTVVLAAPAFPLWLLLHGRGTTALLLQPDEREQFLEARSRCRLVAEIAARPGSSVTLRAVAFLHSPVRQDGGTAPT